MSGEEDGSDEFVVAESEALAGGAQLSDIHLASTAGGRKDIANLVRDGGDGYAPKVKEFLSTIAYGASPEKVAGLYSELTPEEVVQLESIFDSSINSLRQTEPLEAKPLPPRFQCNAYVFPNEGRYVMIFLNRDIH